MLGIEMLGVFFFLFLFFLSLVDRRSMKGGKVFGILERKEERAGVSIQ